ncbi:hypothetical protein L596_003779 [Steinernema carpocapsae]|uniref:PA domain-containing protein n=1 Tax=Steinernema carpocapsae TaxID=34508 RepID=A0A4U8UX06_STECR|nr:hypothetical protein L596_003779 [Steinernema carpocapsae]
MYVEVELFELIKDSNSWDTFGSPLDAILVLSSPPDACKPLKNVMDVYGSVVLVERGRCSFTDKVLNAERAGASFVIVSDVLNATDDLIEMVRDENDARARAGIPVAYLNGASGP